MGRVRMALAAAVASALAVAAVAALDAVGADKVAAADDPAAAFADCMRDHGAAIPNLGGVALERWLKTHPLPDATARTCKVAIAPPIDKRVAAADARRLAACLRARGLNPPTEPIALKQWIGAHRGAAVDHALEDCGVGPAPACGDKDDPAVKQADAAKRKAAGE